MTNDNTKTFSNMKKYPLSISENHEEILDKYYSSPISEREKYFQINKHNMAPQFLYKYKGSPFSNQSEKDIERDKDRLKEILLDGKLFLSSCQQFNDPFDVCPVYKNDHTDDEVRENTLRIFKSHAPHVTPTEESLRLAVEDYRNGGSQKTIDHIKNSLNRLGIFCFTSKHENILMWSHYAESHTGICIRFNLLNQIEIAQTTFPIEYKTQRPVANAYKKQDFDDYKNTILTKSNDWSYENEWRHTNRIHKLKKIPLNNDVVDEVLIGSKATTDTINFIHQINEERKNRNMPQFKITQTMIHCTEFKIIAK